LKQGIPPCKRICFFHKVFVISFSIVTWPNTTRSDKYVTACLGFAYMLKLMPPIVHSRLPLSTTLVQSCCWKQQSTTSLSRVLCTKNGEQVIEEKHSQGSGSKRAMKHDACISSNRRRAWGIRDRRMAKKRVAGAMQGIRNIDQKVLHAGSGNEEGIESQVCTHACT
jgi:hypothetical protein